MIPNSNATADATFITWITSFKRIQQDRKALQIKGINKK